VAKAAAGIRTEGRRAGECTTKSTKGSEVLAFVIFVTFVVKCSRETKNWRVSSTRGSYYYQATSCFPEKIFSHKKAQNAQKHRRYSAVHCLRILYY
jgi:hypothetical protein